MVDEETRDTLVQKFPELKSRPKETNNTDINFFSLSAGQVLEVAGVNKGHTTGEVGTYDKHCLIIVNHGEKN
jgi:UDP-N-acetylenolpyruvoylglucosamine reductase